MKKICLFILITSSISSNIFSQGARSKTFPDGTKIPAWFYQTTKVKTGRQFSINDYGAVNDSTLLQTGKIQAAIDAAYKNGGGVVVIAGGTYLSGALFFKPNTKLYVAEGAVLKGSDNIADYPQMPSRIEGQNLDYFPALVNAYGVNGFSIGGKGIIDGNGLKYWEAFWQRRKENPQCTNLEVSRPRLLFVWKSNNVQIEDITLQNAGFWSSHYYQCNFVKILGVRITSPHDPVKAPSTDAIDLDVCNNVLIKNCYMSVNDDAIALKGGKGPWADQVPSNGGNSNIIIEDCEFGFSHSALTCGSEAIHNRNIIMRNCTVKDAKRLLWLKMRPDTPQEYEYITVEDIKGEAYSLIYVKPWKQFFDLKGRKDTPLSYSHHVKLKNIQFNCDVFFDVDPGEHDRLSDFSFENLDVTTKKAAMNKSLIKGFELKQVKVNGKLIN